MDFLTSRTLYVFTRVLRPPPDFRPRRLPRRSRFHGRRHKPTFDSFIQKMRQLPVTAGCGAEIHGPGSNTTRGQMSVVIERAACSAQ